MRQIGNRQLIQPGCLSRQVEINKAEQRKRMQTRLRLARVGGGSLSWTGTAKLARKDLRLTLFYYPLFCSVK